MIIIIIPHSIIIITITTIIIIISSSSSVVKVVDSQAGWPGVSVCLVKCWCQAKHQLELLQRCTEVPSPSLSLSPRRWRGLWHDSLMTTLSDNPTEICTRNVVVILLDLLDLPAAGPARTSPSTRWQSTESQINMASECLVCERRFLQSGHMVKDDDAATRDNAWHWWKTGGCGDLVVLDELLPSNLALHLECLQSPNIRGKQSPCLGGIQQHKHE